MLSFVQFWWLRLPVVLRRVNRFISEVWFDGVYLTAWPKVALAAPALVFLFGLWEGATHRAFDFVQISPLLFVAAICGALSSQLGLLLVTGFAFGDLLIAGTIFSHGHPAVWALSHIYAPQLISYLGFFLLAVTPSLTASAMACSLPSGLRKIGWLHLVITGLVASVVEGVSVYAWTFAAPMIVRVHWLWIGSLPPVDVVEFSRAVDPLLPVAATAAMAVRMALSFSARHKLNLPAITKARQAMTVVDRKARNGFNRKLLRITGAALLSTMVLAGLFNSLLRAVFIFAIVWGLFFARDVVLPTIPLAAFWSDRIRRLPLVLRWIASIAGAFGLTRSILFVPVLSARANGTAGAFGAEIFCFLLSLCLAFLLFPAQPTTRPISRPAPLSRAARVGANAVLFICIFGLSTRTAYAGLCLDPVCCFGSNSLLAALVVVALLLPLILVLADVAGLGVLGEMLFDTVMAIAPETAESTLLDAEIDAVTSSSTFETNGLSKAVVDDYLTTAEGQSYLDELNAADSDATIEDLINRSQRQLQTGSELPTLNGNFTGQLVKIVPEGQTVTSYSPFFTSQEVIDQVIASGEPLGDAFGLPLVSQSEVYDVLTISPPSGGGVVFSTTVAPTTELGGTVVTEGGGTQYLVPNRIGWSAPMKTGTISNVAGRLVQE